MSFHSLQKLLPQAANKHGFGRQLKAIQICQEYRNLAPEFLPKAALEQTFPKSYDRQTLTVGVFNSLWAGQVTMQKHHILEAINKKFGAETLKNIRVEMSEEPSVSF